MSPSDWHYTGDIDLQNGGLYWKLNRLFDDYVEAVEVQGTTVYVGTIYMPEDKLETALETCGYRIQHGCIVDCTGKFHADQLPLKVDAFYAYWGLNEHFPNKFTVQIGGPRKTEADYRIAHNANFRRFVEGEFLHG